MKLSICSLAVLGVVGTVLLQTEVSSAQRGRENEGPRLSFSVNPDGATEQRLCGRLSNGPIVIAGKQVVAFQIVPANGSETPLDVNEFQDQVVDSLGRNVCVEGNWNVEGYFSVNSIRPEALQTPSESSEEFERPAAIFGRPPIRPIPGTPGRNRDPRCPGFNDCMG